MERNKNNKILDSVMTGIIILAITLVGVFLLKEEKAEEAVVMPANNEIYYIESSEETENMLININTAPKEELMLLTSIGKSRAEAIIEYRTREPFKSIEEICNVEGIGEGIFDEIRDKICVE